MKQLLLIVTIFMISCSLNSGIVLHNTINLDTTISIRSIDPINNDWNILINALIFTESNNNIKAIGKHNDVGVLQLTPIYVKEVNRILKSNKYKLSDRFNRNKSIEMFNIIQSHYNPNKSISKAIKLHNPRSKQSYKNKILAIYKQLKRNNLC